jgi:hypothetical protein
VGYGGINKKRRGMKRNIDRKGEKEKEGRGRRISSKSGIWRNKQE